MRECYEEHEVESAMFLLEQWPESIQDRGPGGRPLVLHALDSPATPGRRVVLTLLQTWLKAALAVDRDGFLPFHVAALADSSLDLLCSMLLQQLVVLLRSFRTPSPQRPSLDRSICRRVRTGDSKDEVGVGICRRLTQYLPRGVSVRVRRNQLVACDHRARQLQQNRRKYNWCNSQSNQ